jgi:hypothetical protein
MVSFQGYVFLMQLSVLINSVMSSLQLLVLLNAFCWQLTEEEHEKVDEVHHWVNERYAAVALIPIIPAALLYPHPVLDTLLVSAMVMHTHW